MAPTRTRATTTPPRPPDGPRALLAAAVLVAMVVFAIFAVGGVYPWGAMPLMGAAVLLAAVARPRLGRSPETRTLDLLLCVSVAALALQLVPLPPGVSAALSPNAARVRAASELVPLDPAAWQRLSIAPHATAYAVGMVLTALIAFWAARWSCARGMTRGIVRHVVLAGLVAALAGIALRAVGDRTLIYGQWPALDAGARPFGPFVNRNHFATWLLMACPLAAGYLAASVRVRRSWRGMAAAFVDVFQRMGSSTAWVAVAGMVMTLALAISASRSGLLAFAASIAAGAWFARHRLTRETARLGLVGVLALGAVAVAYLDLQPLLARVEETLAVGAAERPRIWQETLRVIQDFPLTGTGLGSYQAAMLVYQQTDPAVFINQAHNQYLHFLSEGGLLLGIPAALTAVAFVRVFRARLAHDTSSTAWLRIGGATAMLAVAVQGLWETGLRIPANGLLFGLAAAVAVHEPGGERGFRKPSSAGESAGPVDA